MDDHLVALAGDWALRRDFAVRSAGFPVSGLDASGTEDEPARLRAVAADPAFREALTWQNRGALAKPCVVSLSICGISEICVISFNL